MDSEDEKILKLLSASGTLQVLELLDTHGKAQHIKMQGPVSNPTLNTRLRDLQTVINYYSFMYYATKTYFHKEVYTRLLS